MNETCGGTGWVKAELWDHKYLPGDDRPCYGCPKCPEPSLNMKHVEHIGNWPANKLILNDSPDGIHLFDWLPAAEYEWTGEVALELVMEIRWEEWSKNLR